MRRRIALAASAAALGLALSASPALAVTGGNLTNSSSSYPVAIRAFITSSSYVNIYRGQTTKGSTYAGRVIGFEQIDPLCSLRSQYSPSGSWPYKGGVYYPYSQNNLDLVLTVRCTT